jgi:hypothetical protein
MEEGLLALTRLIMQMRSLLRLLHYLQLRRFRRCPSGVASLLLRTGGYQWMN